MKRLKAIKSNKNTNLLTILLKEWEQTIDEAKIYFEADKNIIKQTILLSITVFASIVVFETSDKVNNNLKISLYPAYLFVPILYLTLSFYSYYHTLLRYLISKYWLEILFPRIEQLASSIHPIERMHSKEFVKKNLEYLQYQIYYRENLNIFFKIGIFLYRGVPVILGLISSLVYSVFVIPELKNNSNFAKYLSVDLQIIISIFLVLCFLILLLILMWGIFKMSSQKST